jgi:hypothetical protein
MKKQLNAKLALKLRRESIQLLEGGLGDVRGASGQGCSLSNCLSCRVPTCTTK